MFHSYSRKEGKENAPTQYWLQVYHAYLEGDTYYRTDGTRIKGLADGPLTPAEATPAF